MPVQTELSKTQVMHSILRWIPIIAGWPGRYINVRRCEGWAGALLQLKVTLELFAKRREFITGSGFLTRRDMT